MNQTFESAIRFVNLTTSGLLAGSLGFGESALTPGWENERAGSSGGKRALSEAEKYFNAIGPIALASAMTLVVGSRKKESSRRILDALSALGLAGVVATTLLGTVPINHEIELQPPADYPSDISQALTKNWSRAHAMRTALGITAFVCAVGSSVAGAMSPQTR